MSAADWDFAEQSTRVPAEIKPKRDVVAPDGYKLVLGDAMLSLNLTPGHTPGTISTIFTVRDGARSHTVATWGGTSFNFQLSPQAFQARGFFWQGIRCQQRLRPCERSQHRSRYGAGSSLRERTKPAVAQEIGRQAVRGPRRGEAAQHAIACAGCGTLASVRTARAARNAPPAIGPPSVEVVSAITYQWRACARKP